ncbi:hypothetical protein C8R47DRAFT_1107920 [Mycena vitilis]|nr:hypothetical protein C8R47DRAFT_1107920 [Mycena vitilis]
MTKPSEDAPLDLYSIALLLNYESASADIRFRNTKLWDFASGSTPFAVTDDEKVAGYLPEWTAYSGPGTKDGFIFSRDPAGATGPDLPSTMLPSRVPAHLKHLTQKQLETIFWQARGHDGCYRSVALLDHFFKLVSPDISVSVRIPNGQSFVVPAASRVILELKLVQPKRMTVSIIQGVGGAIHINGDEGTMDHAVVGFPAPASTSYILDVRDISTVLDLSSLQFGDAGRGVRGRSTFVLESLDAFNKRVENIARGALNHKISLAFRKGPPPNIDEWIRAAAGRAKERWEARDTKPWCGHCGAPSETLRKCTSCQRESYCDEAHQFAAWPFHKHFCSGNKK